MCKFFTYVLVSFLLTACGVKLPGSVTESCNQKPFNPYNHYLIINNLSNEINAVSWSGADGDCYADQVGTLYRNVKSGATGHGAFVSTDIVSSFAPNGGTLHFDASPLMAIQLSPGNTAYYSGYPVGKQSQLGTWLNANQPAILSALGAATPLPTQSSMNQYGLYYLLDNAGKASLGMPTRNPDRVDAYTSLDPSNRAYDPNNFVITFTVNGPTAADVAITFSATPR